jgi:rifampicin phosphotransferase
MAEHHPEPQPIPTPDNFPIDWADPADSHLPLMQDVQHAPLPLTPLSGWLADNHWGRGSSAGMAAIGQPLTLQTRRINTYYYLSVTPSVPPEQMEEAGHKAEVALKELMPVYADRWRNEWLPEVQSHHNRWNAFDLQGATDFELIEHLDWTIDAFARLWDIHFQLMVPALVGPSMLLDLYNDLIEDAGPMDAYKLTQGFDNTSLRAGEDLWKLSQVATASEEVRNVIENTEIGEIMAVLEQSEAGRSFIGEIGKYAQMWGMRSDTVIEIADPSWVEDPTIVISNLKAYLAGNSEDPRERWNEIVEERERLVAEAHSRISSYPEPVKQQFGGMLQAGQNGHWLQEDHNWWIDQQGNHQVRQVYLEFGNRLASTGAIPTRDDVFMLDGDEIMEAAKSGFRGDFQAIIAERTAEMEKWGKIPAALRIGTDYGPPPDNPVTRAIGRFFGWGPIAARDDSPDTLQGRPGSSGKVTGTARVIIKLSDAGKLNNGDILVTATTSPPWTPLFATAGGIVTDAGGGAEPLRHRSSRIPHTGSRRHHARYPTDQRRRPDRSRRRRRNCAYSLVRPKHSDMWERITL